MLRKLNFDALKKKKSGTLIIINIFLMLQITLIKELLVKAGIDFYGLFVILKAN